MILQEVEGGLLVFRQTDHALLSGALATAWGSEAVPVPERREGVLVAAARHDDGWAEWELAPTVDADGRPVDFLRVPLDEHVELYARGIGLVCREDAYAGLVASMHGERLYTRAFQPGMDPRIEHLEGRDLELAEAYVAGERRRQQELVTGIGAEGLWEQAEEAWRLLQVWDRLSLLACMRPLGPDAQWTMPPILGAGTEVQIEARGSEEGDLLLSPYPLATEPVTFSVATTFLEGRAWPSDRALREAYRAGERRTLSLRCLRG